jgi:hypothetical protein
METQVKKRLNFIIAAIISFAGGFLILMIDSSKGWDDTGITVGMLFILSAFCGLLAPEKFWLWALLSGLWIPINGIIKHNDFMFLLILLIPFAGSIAGAVLRNFIIRKNDDK